MMKIKDFQHTKKSNISCVPKTQSVFKDAKNQRFLNMNKIPIWICILICLSSFASASSLIDVSYYWNMDNANITGTVMHDSKNANNLTFTGATTGQTGIVNEAVSFDGDNDDAALQSQVALSDVTNWTIDYWYKGNQADQAGVWGNPVFGRDNADAYAQLNLRNGIPCMVTYAAGFNYCCGTTNISDGTWHYVTMVNYANETGVVYVDGVQEGTGPTNNGEDVSYRFRIDYLMRGYADVGSSWTEGDLDEVGIYLFAFNHTQAELRYNNGNCLAYDFTAVDTTPPIFSNINCTSCNPPYGDTTEPYTTSDTTPTFSFDTDINAYCAIADENMSYTAMGSTRNCSTTGTTTHICTLTVQDELINPTDYVYVGCANIDNTSLSNTTELLMNITDLEVNASAAIDRGIQASVISGATVYSDQQVYLRELNNNQKLATVDRVATDGNQRWLLNYAESLLGLFNITPAVYVLDMVNISLTDIEDQVTELINSTDS